MPLQHLLAQRPTHRLSPRSAKIAAISLAVVVALMDFAVPTSLQLSISLFYGVIIALCAWTTSRKFLWCTTAAVTVCLFGAGLLHSVARHPPDVMLTLFNRSLRATLLVVIARIVDGWMIDMKSLDAQRTLTRRLLNGLDVAQFIIREVDGEILYWSRGAQKLYGWTTEEAWGKGLTTCFRRILVANLLELSRNTLIVKVLGPANCATLVRMEVRFGWPVNGRSKLMVSTSFQSLPK